MNVTKRKARLVELALRQGGPSCFYCRRDLWLGGTPAGWESNGQWQSGRAGIVSGGTIRYMATVEHLIPRIEGGTNALENLRLACPRCNSKKGSTSLADFLAQRLQEAA